MIIIIMIIIIISTLTCLFFGCHCICVFAIDRNRVVMNSASPNFDTAN